MILKREQPDIVFLQEARVDLLEPEKMGGYFAESWSYPWPGGKTVGVLTLSRVPPVRAERIPTKYRELGVDKDLPLDRVFFTGFDPSTARVLDYESSDHLPILVKLELQA